MYNYFIHSLPFLFFVSKHQILKYIQNGHLGSCRLSIYVSHDTATLFFTFPQIFRASKAWLLPYVGPMANIPPFVFIFGYFMRLCEIEITLKTSSTESKIVTKKVRKQV